MKLSIASWSFTLCSLQEAWDIVHALGIDHMDLGLLHGPRLNRDAVIAAPEEAATQVIEAGVRASNVYWLFGATPFDHPLSDPAARPQNMADLEAVLRFTKALDCPTLFVLPGVNHPGQSSESSVQASVAALNEMCGMAQDHGVTLTVEPHVGGILDSPTKTLEFIERVPGLKLTLDYAHFACMGYPQSQIDPLAKYVAHIHLRQARPGALQAKWGEGTLDFGAMIETLRGVEFKGFLSIEYVHQDYMGTLHDDVLTETIQMRDHVRNFLNS